MENPTPLFTTVESYAWSRDYSYSDYQRLCYKNSVIPCCEEAYSALCTAFDIQMDYDLTAPVDLH